MNARERAARLIELGPSLRDPNTTLGEAALSILIASGLSEAGARLAQTALELSPTPSEEEDLMGFVGDAPTCHVVLSANVATAAFRALILASLASPRVRVRASRRSSGFEALLVGAGTGLDLGLVSDLEAVAPGDEVHVYGSNRALSGVAEKLPAGTRFWGHGHGFGIAVIGPEADLDAAAAALALDVAMFDQRGCLSPRVVFLLGVSPSAFGPKLHQALESSVARGPLSSAEATSDVLFRRASAALGPTWQGPEHVVTFGGDFTLPPTTRAVLMLSICSPSEIWKAGAGRDVTSCGVTGLNLADEHELRAEATALGVRVGPLGRMQRPPLDGPVDRRTSKLIL